MLPLAIVILNYRTAELVINCLKTLDPEREHQVFHVVVVDNSSPDGSADCIERFLITTGWTEWVTLQRSPENGGFSAGNNIGIRSINAANYLLLNSDTLVQHGAIRELMLQLDQVPEAGLIGPELQNPDGTRQVSCFRFPTPVSEFIRAAHTQVITHLLKRWNVPVSAPPPNQTHDWISFAAVLIRREVFETAGLLDDGFFMYFEDVDFCRTIRAVGWEIYHCPQAQVVHLHGQSSGINELRKGARRRPTYYYSSRSRYFRKWSGVAGLIIANLAWQLGRIPGTMRDLLRRERTSTRLEWLDNWVDFRPRPHRTSGHLTTPDTTSPSSH